MVLFKGVNYCFPVFKGRNTMIYSYYRHNKIISIDLSREMNIFEQCLKPEKLVKSRS